MPKLSKRPNLPLYQVIIFLSLVFPALGLDDRNDTRRQDFERVMRTDENIVDGHRQVHVAWLSSRLLWIQNIFSGSEPPSSYPSSQISNLIKIQAFIFYPQ